MNIGIKNIKSLNKGRVGIYCENKKDIETLKNEVEEKMGGQYNVSVSKKKHPRIKMVGIEEKINEEDIKDCIAKQNRHICGDNTKIELKAMYKGKVGYTAILETDTETYDKIIKEGRLRIGWMICPIYESVNIMRCYNCCGFYHKAEQCKNRVACGKCGEEHLTRNCNNENTKCVNCSMACERLNLHLDTKHTAFDIECNVYKKKIQQERNKYQYESSE